MVYEHPKQTIEEMEKKKLENEERLRQPDENAKNLIAEIDRIIEERDLQ